MIVKSNDYHPMTPDIRQPNGKASKIVDENEVKKHEESLQTVLKDNNGDQNCLNVENESESDDKPLTLNIEINSIAWILFAVGFGLRFYRLSEPSSVVYVLCLMSYEMRINLLFTKLSFDSTVLMNYITESLLVFI